MEMYEAIRTKKPPVMLSVQDVMDCSGLEKCNGRGGREDMVYEDLSSHY